MRRFTLSFIAFIITACSWSRANCQYYFYNEDYYETAFTWQIGTAAGGMNCLTDLGGRKAVGRGFLKDINWNGTRPCAGFFVGCNYKGIIAARLELVFGQVVANDNVLKNDGTAAYGRYIRNLNFRSNIRELSCSFELYPFSIFQSNMTAPPLITPYIFAGIGSFNFSPESFYNNVWINLSELHTEGQGFKEYPNRKPYKLTQFNLPVGLGLKYEAAAFLSLHVEITYRKLWTDYLDDVSKTYIDPELFQRYFTPLKANLATKLADQRGTNDPGIIRKPGDIRGNDKNNDTYFSSTLKIAFIIGRQRRW